MKKIFLNKKNNINYYKLHKLKLKLTNNELTK